ncbi:speckle-type POZ protein B-like isoform X4 [Planococcus citri]|uniref:speckle-type POZ protein B-like isoform X4 n=1 Tax=Planococcus citri TaxID=170843 RepID=UPI0031F79C83
MSSHYNLPNASAGNRFGTRIKLHEATIIWTIENFRFHEAIGKLLESPTFSAIDDNETKWYTKLEPNGDNSENNDYITFRVSLYPGCERKEAFAEFSAYILDKDFKETSAFKKTLKVYQFFSSSPSAAHGNRWGWAKFQIKDEDFRSNLLIDDKLTIKCVITYYLPDAVDNTANECYNTRLYPDVPECNLSHHYGLLLENRDIADVVLSIKGKEFSAHKVILAARSPVFAVMFKHDAKENKENRVNIDDMDEEVVSEMLRYIYTGKCEKLPELAYGLLAAGDKYDLNHLKMICAEELYKNLSVENAASILALADMHGVKELKNEVIKFITTRPTEILNTAGWKSIRSNFELADEVSLAIARR